MKRTRIKICGITRPEDALRAAELGPDAIGLVFYGPSPRVVTAKQALSVIEVLPPFITVVGLFVNATRDELNNLNIDELTPKEALDLLYELKGRS